MSLSQAGLFMLRAIWVKLIVYAMVLLANELFLLASRGGEFEFPAGVPLKASEVTFYAPTDHYQQAGGVHNRTYNISALAYRQGPMDLLNFRLPTGLRQPEAFGNANYEFPWGTGGMDLAKNAESYKFHKFPKGGKIAYWFEQTAQHPAGYQVQSPDENGPIHRWTYPEGMVFGEVLQMGGHTFEVRVMTKVQGKFNFRTFRPFGIREDLKGDIVSESWTSGELSDRHPGEVVNLTALEHHVVVKDANAVLRRPFRDVTGVVWAEGVDGRKCYCPTGGVTPEGYQGAFLSAESCAKCHDTCQQHTRHFQPVRDWYGSVRGSSDGVFSFSIFDDSCAARNGSTLPVRLDRILVEAGLIEKR